MKGDTQVIVIVAFFFIGFLFGTSTSESLLIIRDYLPALITLAAAFGGAHYAYVLQRYIENDKKQEQSRVSGNLAVMQLARMQNCLINYRDQFMEPVRDHPIAFVTMQPCLSIADETFRLNLENLYFILETDDPDLLGQISICERKFFGAGTAIEERSRLHRQEAQPRFEENGFEITGEYSMEQIQAALGARIFVTLQHSTQQIFLTIDDAIEHIQRIHARLTNSLRKQFPGKNIVGISNPSQRA